MSSSKLEIHCKCYDEQARLKLHHRTKIYNEANIPQLERHLSRQRAKCTILLESLKHQWRKMSANQRTLPIDVGLSRYAHHSQFEVSHPTIKDLHRHTPRILFSVFIVFVSKFVYTHNLSKLESSLLVQLAERLFWSKLTESANKITVGHGCVLEIKELRVPEPYALKTVASPSFPLTLYFTNLIRVNSNCRWNEWDAHSDAILTRCHWSNDMFFGAVVVDVARSIFLSAAARNRCENCLPCSFAI